VGEEVRFYRATGAYGFLSNLYRHALYFDGHLFEAAEYAYQFGKPRDPKVARWLSLAPRPHLCAAAAHALFVFDVREDWNQIKVERMRKVLAQKFPPVCYPGLCELLLATGDACLVEDSKTDAFWGIGKKGNGKNMLGVLLMERRAQLTSEVQRG